MRTSGAAVLPGSRTLRAALTQLLLLAAVLGLVECALFVDSAEGPFGVLVLITLTGWVYVVTGAFAWARRPSNRMGPLLCAGGIVWLLAALRNTESPALVAVGQIVATVPVAVVLHALLAFPSGRLPGRGSLALVVAGYVATLVLQAPAYLFADATATGTSALLLADRPDLLAVGRAVNAIAAAAVILATSAVLVRRLWVASPRARRVLAPLYGYGVLAVVTVSFAANLRRLLEFDPLVLFLVQIAVLAGIPVAFTAGVLLGGFARTAEIEELGAWLGTAERGRSELGAALARTLGDPSLQLVFRSADDGWVDGTGRRAVIPEDRTSLGVQLGDRPVGAIIYDATLLPDPDVVGSAGRVVAIAVDRERLTAQLLAGQEQLRVSRTRLVEAGDQERRRLAHDLHDRLQGRLVLVAMRLGSLGRADEDVEQVRWDLDEAISELRLVVQDVMPTLLIERGLAAAVEEMAVRTPLHTVVEIGGDDQDSRRLPESVEGTAYYVVSEAITNAVKHSDAGELRISMHRRDGMLHLEVGDDGRGGAAPGGGAGLRGIADRVDALGGRLEIDSPAGHGTRLAVRIPCGS